MSDGDAVLRSVSRSFYLSLRALPRPLRTPVGLAYLLARTSDTIADTVGIEVPLRVEMLDRFAAATAGDGNAASLARDLEEQFVPRQVDAAEKTLIARVSTTLAQLEALPPEDRTEIRNLLTIIISGQRLDLERWPEGLSALPNAAALREYTYLVAGCVGEFWTRIGFRKIDRFADKSLEEMLALGRRYGSGLQLVNILRDVGADLRAGRCYFPADELTQAGLSPAQLLASPRNFEPILRRWVKEAREGLWSGIEYSCALRGARLRLATALPALLGIKTLKLIEQAGAGVLQNRIKVPRAEVRNLVATTAITLASPERLRASFTRSR